MVFFVAASEAGKGSIAYYAGAALLGTEFLGLNATLLWKRCSQPGSGSALIYVSAGLATPMLMFVNPIDKSGRPFVPWILFYVYRATSLMIRWAAIAVFIKTDSVCFTTTPGIVLFADGAVLGCALLATTWYLWKTRDLRSPSTFWVGAEADQGEHIDAAATSEALATTADDENQTTFGF